MTLKSKIKSFIPLLPLLKTEQSYRLEIRREQRQPPKNESPYFFGKADYRRDFEEIVEMFDISFVAYLKVTPEEKETFLQKRFDSNIPCFVVRDDTQLAGFVWLSPHQVNQSPNSYAATNLFVAKKFRGQGLAKLLLMTAVNTVFSETDVPKIVSTVYETNTASLQTHLKAGFVIAGMNKVQHLGRMSNEKFVPLKNNSREVQ